MAIENVTDWVTINMSATRMDLEYLKVNMDDAFLVINGIIVTCKYTRSNKLLFSVFRKNSLFQRKTNHITASRYIHELLLKTVLFFFNVYTHKYLFSHRRFNKHIGKRICARIEYTYCTEERIGNVGNYLCLFSSKNSKSRKKTFTQHSTFRTHTHTYTSYY